MTKQKTYLPRRKRSTLTHLSKALREKRALLLDSIHSYRSWLRQRDLPIVPETDNQKLFLELTANPNAEIDEQTLLKMNVKRPRARRTDGDATSSTKAIAENKTRASKKRSHNASPQQGGSTQPVDPRAASAAARRQSSRLPGVVRSPSPPNPLALSPEAPPPSSLPSSSPRNQTPHPPGVEYPIDLTNVFGVPAGAENVNWLDRYITKLPWIPSNEHSPRNLLRRDADHVRQVSVDAKPVEDCPWITFLNYKDFTCPVAFSKEIRKYLAKGHVVVVKGYTTPEVPLNEEAVKARFRISANRPMVVHDCLLRVESFSNPHLSRTFSEFCRYIDDERVVQCVLDCKQTTREIPVFISHLDDGYTSWDASPSHVFPDRPQPMDVTRSQSWMLLHHALYYTYVHHDAEGAGTWTHIQSGHKFWVVSRPGEGFDNAEHRGEVYQSAIPYAQVDVESDQPSMYHHQFDRYVIFGETGDVIIQPPFTLHEVYTPTPSVTVGGHFFSYETMHLTEMCRYFAVKTKGRLTNQEHPSAVATFYRMLSVMPFYPELVFYKKPITALCRLVLKQEDYTMKKHVAQSRSDTKFATRIANFLEKSLHLDLNIRTWKENTTSAPQHDYIFEGDSWMDSWMDPGPTIDIRRQLRKIYDWDFKLEAK